MKKLAKSVNNFYMYTNYINSKLHLLYFCKVFALLQCKINVLQNLLLHSSYVNESLPYPLHISENTCFHNYHLFCFLFESYIIYFITPMMMIQLITIFRPIQRRISIYIRKNNSFYEAWAAWPIQSKKIYFVFLYSC